MTLTLTVETLKKLPIVAPPLNGVKLKVPNLKSVLLICNPVAEPVLVAIPENRFVVTEGLVMLVVNEPGPEPPEGV